MEYALIRFLFTSLFLQTIKTFMVNQKWGIKSINNNKNNNKMMIMSILDERSVSCLDFSFVLESLRAETVTKLGGQSFDKYQSSDCEVVSEMYRRVEELSSIVGYVPPMGTMDFLKALVPIGCCYCYVIIVVIAVVIVVLLSPTIQ